MDARVSVCWGMAARGIIIYVLALMALPGMGGMIRSGEPEV